MEVILEVKSVYKRPVKDRKVYKTEYVVNAFKKLYLNSYTLQKYYKNQK